MLIQLNYFYGSKVSSSVQIRSVCHYIQINQGAAICVSVVLVTANYAAWGQPSSSGSLIELSCCHTNYIVNDSNKVTALCPMADIQRMDCNPTRASGAPVMDVCVAVDGHLMDALNYLPP
jgi:hypothetical protein